MKKLLLVSLCFLLLVMTQVHAQNRTITGTVKAREDGLPLPGVTVRVKGSPIAAATNGNGKYTIANVPANATLTFTSTGYLGVDFPVPASGVLDVTMETSSHELNEVVINTAFGIAKSASTLGYDATAIGGKLITEAGATNFTNGLTGKVAGLVVTTGDNGINPATRFVLRGNRHISGNNFALVVLNGVPISPGDVNTINPDDIDDVTVLNGASAAALYGSEASNGVLVITTKKGSSNGAPQINYSNTYQLEKYSYFPPLQTMFGSYGGEGAPFRDANTFFITAPVPYENQSYGPLYDGHMQQLGIPLQDGTIQSYPYANLSPDPRFAFFQTGHTETNSLSYASGDASNGFNLSVNRVDKTNPNPGDTYQRTIVRVGATHTYGIFKADFTASYSNSFTSTGGGNYSTLLNTPSWVPLENFKDYTQPFADRSTFFNSYDINPYDRVANNRTNSRSDAFNGSFSAILTPAKWVDITYRLADNFGVNTSQTTAAQINYTAYALSDPGGTSNRAAAAGTAVVPGTVTNNITFGDGSGAGTNGYNGNAGPGGYARLTQDFITNFHSTFFNDFKTDLRVGSTVWQETGSEVGNGSSNLIIQNFYNLALATGIPSADQSSAKIRQISYFADGTIGYKDWANVEGTIRNEHDSRLSAPNRSIWFPSVNASIVLTNAVNSLKNNKIVSYLKLRGSYAQVGDVNIAPYLYTPASYGLTSNFPYGSLAGITQSTTLNNPNLKPELTKETEFGIDYGLFDGRITGGITYYNNHTTNQTLSIGTSAASGFSSTLINVGDVQNNGIELKLDGQVLTKAKNKVGLDLSGNFAIQGSKVISLIPGVNSVSIGSSEFAQVGLPFPFLVSSDLQRDPLGRVIVNSTTGYTTQNPTPQLLGRMSPKYILGLTQNVSYKFMTLTIVEEFRTGNVFYNGTESSAVAAGSSGFSASNGRSRFIFPNSVINTGTAAAPVYVPNTNVAVEDGGIGFWNLSGAFFNTTSVFTESAAFWKIREADLSFDLSQWVKKSKAIKRAAFTLNGRNLFMWVPKSNTSHTDPEFGSTGNAIGQQGTAQLPPTRLFGATLSVTF